MKCCPNCKQSFERLSAHWAHSSCEYPNIDRRHHKILTGLLMAEGNIHFPNEGNPSFKIDNTNRRFLEWLDTEFGCLSSGITVKKSAEESARDIRERGRDKEADASNYSTIYRFRSRNHPGLKKYKPWYEQDWENLPDDLSLTPWSLKMWYIGHGNYREGRKGIRINCTKQRGNEDQLCSLFDSIDISPWFEESNRGDGSEIYVMGFNRSDTEKFFKYIGPPVQGVAEMWPKEWRHDHDSPRQNVYLDS